MLQAIRSPPIQQCLDSGPENDRTKQDDDDVAVGKEQVADRGKPILKPAHLTRLSSMRPPKSGQERWLAAGTLVER
jgi:hypothetical protein